MEPSSEFDETTQDTFEENQDEVERIEKIVTLGRFASFLDEKEAIGAAYRDDKMAD
jgi:hypothetical protein